MSVKKSLAACLANKFIDFNEDNYFGFYDWFCEEDELEEHADFLIEKVKQICSQKLTKFNCSDVYVFFKNSCTGMGNTYDEFKICDLKTDEVIYDVIPCSGHSGEAEVWGKENDFKEPIVSGSWGRVRDFFEGI